ncbi:MAG: ATPase, partial [Eggerthellaceae bacterium]|nr:ATPase [Eggerthellaceae bacterium]
YIVDCGIRNYLEGYRMTDYGRLFENVVYLQLLYDGYDVFTGTLYGAEIDFVATRPAEKLYIQVTQDMTDPRTQKRELDPLRAIRDSNPKMVIVFNGNYPTDIDGIRIIKGIDFLLGRWPGH